MKFDSSPMEHPPLSFDSVLNAFKETLQSCSDPRKPSNNTRYTLLDLFLGAFSVFFMQNPSFLEHQRHLQSRCGHHNLQTLFGAIKIATSVQIRNVLDRVPAARLFGVFEWVYHALRVRGFFKPYEILGGQLLVALDGSEYHSSTQVHCPCCSHRTSKTGKVTYFHSALLPAIVHPDHSRVISLAPEFISPQDGHDKQDCERAAAKRWMTRMAPTFQGQPITLLGDDLYSNYPLIKQALDHNLNFLFVCLPQTHTTLMEWVEFLERSGQGQTWTQTLYPRGQAELWSFRYVNQVPLRQQEPTLHLNWFEVHVTRLRDGKLLYHNSWVTNHELTPALLPELGAAGRARWKTENENHNVLKTRGYHLEHNFGHGQQHLAQLLLTLNLLAFLFHTVLEGTDQRYQRARQRRGTRQGFFQDLVSLTSYLLFESWQHLMDFLLDDSLQTFAPRPANSS